MRWGMKTHDSIEIAAPREAVWPYIADPQRMSDWHAKLDAVRRADIGEVYAGERYGATYAMNPKKSRRDDCETEVLGVEPWTTVALRHRMGVKGLSHYVDETYQLWPINEGQGTRVEQTVDFAGAGLPLWARSLMWCITRTGKPAGPGILEPLKRACESPTRSSAC
jgi:uncharacterized protein YndB with AHSA1/START domain